MGITFSKLRIAGQHYRGFRSRRIGKNQLLGPLLSFFYFDSSLPHLIWPGLALVLRYEGQSDAVCLVKGNT
jgi:hypothetical protein